MLCYNTQYSTKYSITLLIYQHFWSDFCPGFSLSLIFLFSFTFVFISTEKKNKYHLLSSHCTTSTWLMEFSPITRSPQCFHVVCFSSLCVAASFALNHHFIKDDEQSLRLQRLKRLHVMWKNWVVWVRCLITA